MKKKFTKILGVGLTLALLCSLLLTAAPVSAVTTPVVTLTDGPVADTAGVISKLNVYTVLFTTGAAVPIGDEIVVAFEAGTNLDAIVTGDVLIDSSTGIGGHDYSSGTPVVTVSGTYPAAQTLTITIPGTGKIGAGAIVQLTIGVTNYITNPATAGTYNLTVATQTAVPVVIEPAVTSAAYTIIVPTIPGLPGVASVYNPTGVLMAQKNDLFDAVAAAGVDYTVQVGPGTYKLTADEAVTIAHAGLTLISTAGAATTIIDASLVTGGAPADGAGIFINAAGVTVDGFTIEDAGACGIYVNGVDAIVQNNVVTNTSFGTGIDVATGATGVTVSGNVLNEYAGIILHGSTCTVSGNTFGHIMNFWALGVLEGVTITDNNFVANEDANFGILLRGDTFATTIDDTLIEGNTIDGRANGGILIGADSVTALIVTNLAITGNDITNHGDDTGDLDDSGIKIWAGTNWGVGNVIKFNTITGNEDYGIVISGDLAAAATIDAGLNWWGTTVAADIAAMVSGSTNNPVDTTPFLVGTADTVFSATAAGDGTSLDASTTVGVAVSGIETGDPAEAIAVAKYITNPQAAIDGAIAFYDVYVAGAADADEVTIKFYAGDALTDVYLWSAGTETWGDPLTAVFSAYGGYVYVTETADMLGGTPFALVAGAGAALDTPPEILAPETGDDTVSLTPIFAWGTVAGADGYNFQLADNANFVTPMVKLDGDLGRLVVTAYAYVGELPYSTAYYWRVQAVSGTVAAGDLGESPWSTGVFITMDEPAEELPPVVVQEQPPVIIEPIVEVITPAATEITPSWIYVIIGVGAVLVIALLVLIVRTRRVA